MDVGVNAVILGPITIGNGAVIGAGSVAIRSINAGDVVAGNPARLKILMDRWIDLAIELSNLRLTKEKD